MASLDFRPFEVRFAGLAQHDDPKTQLPGALETCDNAVFTEKGAIGKRYGMHVVPVVEDIEGDAIDPANLLCNAASIHGELLVIGYDEAYALASRLVDIGSGRFAPRGPTFRGNVRVFNISTSTLSEAPPTE